MHYDELAERVRFHKQQSKEIETMCRIFEEYGNEVAVERIAKTRNEFVEDLLRDGSLSLERIAAIAKVPLDQLFS